MRQCQTYHGSATRCVAQWRIIRQSALISLYSAVIRASNWEESWGQSSCALWIQGARRAFASLLRSRLAPGESILGRGKPDLHIRVNPADMPAAVLGVTFVCGIMLAMRVGTPARHRTAGLDAHLEAPAAANRLPAPHERTARFNVVAHPVLNDVLLFRTRRNPCDRK